MSSQWIYSRREMMFHLLVEAGYPRDLIMAVMDRHSLRLLEAKMTIWGIAFAFFTVLSAFHFRFDAGNPVPIYMLPATCAGLIYCMVRFILALRKRRAAETIIMQHKYDKAEKYKLVLLVGEMMANNP